MSVDRLEKVSEDEADKEVVETPVAPLIAPALEILTVGVFKKLVNPVADSKLTPLTRLVLLFEATGKSMPFKVLELLVLVALVKARLRPFTVVAVEEALPLVKLRV